jgi:hypothetical protein
MVPPLRKIVSVGFIVTLSGACHNAAAPAVAPPEPTAAEAPPPPPPPPPPKKCENLSENCVAAADTRARIASSDLTFGPAASWTYAQQPSVTIAQTSDSGPALAFTGVDLDAKDTKKDAGNKDAALLELVKQLGLTGLKPKLSWKKTDETKTIGDLKLGLYYSQLKGPAQRGAKKGKVLVVAGPSSSDKGIVGLGFVPEDDKSDADEVVMKCIESLEHAK